nr:uncharacterized protein LOC104095288 [Nicotiana tomentosiformis]
MHGPQKERSASAVQNYAAADFHSCQAKAKNSRPVDSAESELQSLDAQTTNVRKSKIPLYLKWEPPPQRFFKLNTDGAMRQPNTLAGFGGVIRDDEENWVKGYACNIEATSVIHI